MWLEFYKRQKSAMEDNAIMLPSGCALVYVSLVFGIKGEFHQNWLVLLFYKGKSFFGFFSNDIDLLFYFGFF